MDQPTGFLELPVEIRGQIFTELLAARNVRYDKGEGFQDYAFQPQLFRVNKQIHREALEVFRHENQFVTVTTLWTEAEDHVSSQGRIPILMTGEKAHRFLLYQLKAECDLPDTAYNTDKTIFVICAEDLHWFCRLWNYSDLTHGGFNSYLRLTLNVQTLPAPSNPALSSRLSRTAQIRLLEPFTAVKRLAETKIKGPIEDLVKDEILSRMNEPPPTPEECLDECDRLKDEGNKAMTTKDYTRAKELYEKSFEAMHILVNGRLRSVWADPYFDKELRSGRFRDKNGNLIRMVLRIKLVANMVEVYLKLDQPQEARFWGWRSINLMREQMGEEADRPKLEFPAAGAWGKIYYRTGRACQILGDESDARQLFRIAADWLPSDKVVLAARAETALRI